MSLSSDIQVWRGNNRIGKGLIHECYSKEALETFCAKASDIYASVPFVERKVPASLGKEIGGAMKWALMYHLGGKAIDNHPLANDFFKIFSRWENPSHAFMFMRSQENKKRNGHDDMAFFSDHVSLSDGFYRLTDDVLPLAKVFADELWELMFIMRRHFHNRSELAICPYCTTIHNVTITEVWSCQNCGAPLIAHETTIVEKKECFNEWELHPDLASEIGGADIAMHQGPNIVTSRTHNGRVEVKSTDILMILGWKALFNTRDAPPYRNGVVYYTRAGVEFSFNIMEVMKRISFDVEKFQDLVIENSSDYSTQIHVPRWMDVPGWAWDGRE